VLTAPQVDDAYLIGESDGVLRFIPMDSIAGYEVRGTNGGAVMLFIVAVPLTALAAFTVYCKTLQEGCFP
jgi:hypothetical protein